MRSTLVPLAILLAASPLLSQTIDLSKWTVEHVNGTGTWSIDAPKHYAMFTNNAITDCSVLYSDFTLTQIEFRMTVQPVGDDDIIGFVLGFNPGDATNSNSDYLLVDWKKTTQTYSNWGTANAGLAISRVTGVPTPGSGGGPIDFWSHTGVCKELARANTLGATGWGFLTNYYFRVLFTPGFVQIWVNGNEEFKVSGPFKSGGRFGCYNFSQSGMEFQFPVKGTFSLFGKGCQGSAGTPYLFSPSLPEAGQALPVIVANLPPTSPAVLAFGLSNTKWSAFNLPLDLTPFGAAGCTLYASLDLLLPMTNYNGTAYLALPPVNANPGTKFWIQGLSFDPAVNSLGFVFSNGGAAQLGIR